MLFALDLVPVFSFVYLRGKCRYCGSKISWQYPLVEVVAALLSAGVYIIHPAPLSFVFWFVVWMTLLFTVVYDIKHTIIPWSCSGLLALLALLSLFVPEIRHPMSDFNTWTLLAGPLLALPLFLLSLVSWGRWMGWGDSALELSLGWFLGLPLGLNALMMAFWSGALVGLALILYQKVSPQSAKSHGTITMHSEIPFAPYLVLGAALAYFFHVDFFSTVSSLW